MTGLSSRSLLAAFAFCWAGVIFMPGPSPCFGFAQDGDLNALLDRIADRAKSHWEIKSWRAGAATVVSEMDKNWKPKKTTRVKKTVSVTESERSEKVLEALRTEKGVTKDITAEFIREAAEERRDAKDKPADNSTGNKDEQRGMSRSLSLEELLPFSEKARQSYTFVRLQDEVIEGRAVYVLESKAKIKGEKFWEGRYFISPESYDVLRVNLTISKNPKFVKEISTLIDFQVLPDGHFFIKKTWMKVDAGMVIKHIRMVIEEEYSDIEIL
jgi:hypothetical protein